ncbi:MAG: hypothetical protein P1V51_19970 [Deltaproteobacteria bacterium]|nr:hypothetical protein [Deltaproteobacteria bacterium]
MTPKLVVVNGMQYLCSTFSSSENGHLVLEEVVQMRQLPPKQANQPPQLALVDLTKEGMDGTVAIVGPTNILIHNIEAGSELHKAFVAARSGIHLAEGPLPPFKNGGNRA